MWHSSPSTTVLVHHHAGHLVAQEDVLVLIYNMYIWCNFAPGLLGVGRLEELVVDVQLQQVAFFQPVVGLAALAVYLDALGCAPSSGKRA